MINRNLFFCYTPSITVLNFEKLQQQLAEQAKTLKEKDEMIEEKEKTIKQKEETIKEKEEKIEKKEEKIVSSEATFRKNYSEKQAGDFSGKPPCTC